MIKGSNLVSTFCYLSLEGEFGELLYRRCGKCLLRVHTHAAEDDDDHCEDKKHAACSVDEEVGIVILLLHLYS